MPVSKITLPHEKGFSSGAALLLAKCMSSALLSFPFGVVLECGGSSLISPCYVGGLDGER